MTSEAQVNVWNAAVHIRPEPARDAAYTWRAAAQVTISLRCGSCYKKKAVSAAVTDGPSTRHQASTPAVPTSSAVERRVRRENRRARRAGGRQRGQERMSERIVAVVAPR